MLLGGTLTLQLSFNIPIYTPAMCRTFFYPPKATKISCHLRDPICSRARSHLPNMRGNHSFSVLQLILHRFCTLLPLMQTVGSPCQISEVSRQLVWHSRDKGFRAEYIRHRRSHRSAAKRPLDASQSCFTYWAKWWIC